MDLLVPLLKAATICRTCSGFKSGVVFEEVVSPCCGVGTIMFRRVWPCPSLSSYLASDGGSRVVGLGALSSVKALSNPYSSDKRSRLSVMGAMWSSLLVSVLSVCYLQLVMMQPNVTILSSPGDTCCRKPIFC